eukprot:s799_g10.t1
MDPASSALLRSLAGPQARARLIAIPSDEAHVLVQIALRRCLRLALPLASNTCAGSMPEAARSPGQVVEHAWVRVARETIGPEGQADKWRFMQNGLWVPMMVNSSVLAYIFAGRDREQVSLTEVFMPFVFYAAFCLTLAAAFNLASHEAVDVDLGAVGERLGELLLDEFDGDLGEITCEITTATLESFVANFQRPCSAIRRKLVRHYDAEVVRKGAFLCRLYCKTKNAAHESLLRQFSRMRMRDQCEPWILNDRAKSGARPGFWTSLLPRTVRFYDGALPLGVMAEQPSGRNETRIVAVDFLRGRCRRRSGRCLQLVSRLGLRVPGATHMGENSKSGTFPSTFRTIAIRVQHKRPPSSLGRRAVREPGGSRAGFHFDRGSCVCSAWLLPCQAHIDSRYVRRAPAEIFNRAYLWGLDFLATERGMRAMEKGDLLLVAAAGEFADDMDTSTNWAEVFEQEADKFKPDVLIWTPLLGSLVTPYTDKHPEIPAMMATYQPHCIPTNYLTPINMQRLELEAGICRRLSVLVVLEAQTGASGAFDACKYLMSEGKPIPMSMYPQMVWENNFNIEEAASPKLLAYSPGWWPALPDWPKKNVIITGNWKIRKEDQEAAALKGGQLFNAGGQHQACTDFINAGEKPVYIGWGSMMVYSKALPCQSFAMPCWWRGLPWLAGLKVSAMKLFCLALAMPRALGSSGKSIWSIGKHQGSVDILQAQDVEFVEHLLMMPAFSKWSDEYLMEHYGDIILDQAGHIKRPRTDNPDLKMESCSEGLLQYEDYKADHQIPIQIHTCLGMARLFLAGSLAWTASCITLTPQNAEELSLFATLRYFTYDTFDSRTWKVLDGLETCLRSVPSGTTNPWVGAADLWEAQELIYRQLGETAGPHIWRRQGWIEHDPIANNKTVLGLSATLSAPMMPSSNFT